MSGADASLFRWFGTRVVVNLPGGHKNKFYQAWMNMRHRCDGIQKKQFKDYGGRGITYCARWKLFGNFYEDMFSSWKPELSLNRIDNDKGYCKENCNWVTKAEQQRNMRSNTLTVELAREIRKLKADKPDLPLSVIAKKLSLRYHSVYSVLVKGRWND